MINKTTKAIFLSLVMFTQMIVPSFAQETKNKEELKEQIEATNTLTNEELKDDSLTKTEKVNDDIENEESSILETQEDSVTSQEIMSEKRGTISVDINIGTVGNFKISKAVFALYNKELEFIDQKEIFVDNTGVNHNITFNVPEYDVGESFYLSCTEGFDCVKYEENYFGINHKMLLKTSNDVIDKESNEIVYGNNFSAIAYPLPDKAINLALNGYKRNLMFPIKLCDETAIISFPDIVKLFVLEDENYSYDSKTGQITISTEEKNVKLFVGKTSAYINEETKAVASPRIVNGIIYLPLRFVTESLGATLDVETTNNSMKINASVPSIKYVEQNAFINKQGLTSKTNYLLWVSKSNFTVTVFVKTDDGWQAMKDMPCSIGKPSTPTIVGQFEYFSKEKQWSYPKYYVAPIMRFHGGYAFHSTLIKYDGTPYDDRVGKQISLGCVRMRPEDINWMADTIPLYTKVYITN